MRQVNDPPARRCARLCRRGTNAQGAQLWSWWNPATANYFPQRHRLPALDHVSRSVMLSKLSASFDKTVDSLMLGVANTGAVTSRYPSTY